MNEGPSAAEILTAVSRWLEGGAPGAEGFNGKVAANALAIVTREMASGPAAESRATERLEALTGRTGSFDELEAALCAMIESGQIGINNAGLLEHLRASALDRLAIDQPGYRTPLA